MNHFSAIFLVFQDLPILGQKAQDLSIFWPRADSILVGSKDLIQKIPTLQGNMIFALTQNLEERRFIKFGFISLDVNPKEEIKRRTFMEILIITMEQNLYHLIHGLQTLSSESQHIPPPQSSVASQLVTFWFPRSTLEPSTVCRIVRMHAKIDIYLPILFRVLIFASVSICFKLFKREQLLFYRDYFLAQKCKRLFERVS